MIAVIGHTNPDLDSVAAAIGEAKRLSWSGVDAQAYISGVPTKEVDALLQYLQLPLPPHWTLDLADQPTVLVDFNDLEQAPAQLERVIAVVDHHPDSGDLAHISNKLIEPVGSTTTLIANRLLTEYDNRLCKQDCLLLLAAIISDTKGLLSAQTAELDRQTAAELAWRCGKTEEQMTELLFEIGCYTYAPELVPEYMTQSRKCNTINGHLVCSATIDTLELEPFLLHNQEILAKLQLLGGEVQALIVTDLNHQQTAIFHNGLLPLASPYLMAGICSRKREIRQLLEQCLPNDKATLPRPKPQ